MLDNQESRALELRDRLQSIAVDVLARRILKQDPAAYGLSESALSDQTFSRDTKEREQALITVVTQAYRNLWFPGGGGGGQGGKIIRREISTAGGEGGVSVIERIKEVLLNDGELVTAELAGSTTAGASAAKLFFANQDYRTLADLRADFARRRDWPLLEEPSVFDTLIRAGVNHGAWCLFRMGEADSEKPTEFHSRDTGEIPYQVTLTDPGWSVVTPQGAKKRSWTESDKPDPARIRQWVQDEINTTGYCSVAEIAAKVEQDHGSVATPDICKAVDELIKAGHFYVHTVDKNPGHGARCPARRQRLGHGNRQPRVQGRHQARGQQARLGHQKDRPADPDRRRRGQKERSCHSSSRSPRSTRAAASPPSTTWKSAASNSPRAASSTSSFRTWRRRMYAPSTSCSTSPST